MTSAVTVPTIHMYTPESAVVRSAISSPNCVTSMVKVVMTLSLVTRENAGIVGPVEMQGSNRDCPSYTLRVVGGDRAMDSPDNPVAGRGEGGGRGGEGREGRGEEGGS